MEKTQSGTDDCAASSIQNARSPLAGVKRSQDCLPEDGPTPPKVSKPSPNCTKTVGDKQGVQAGCRPFSRPVLTGCSLTVKKPFRRFRSLSDRFSCVGGNLKKTTDFAEKSYSLLSSGRRHSPQTDQKCHSDVGKENALQCDDGAGEKPALIIKISGSKIDAALSTSPGTDSEKGSSSVENFTGSVGMTTNMPVSSSAEQNNDCVSSTSTKVELDSDNHSILVDSEGKYCAANNCSPSGPVPDIVIENCDQGKESCDPVVKEAIPSVKVEKGFESSQHGLESLSEKSFPLSKISEAGDDDGSDMSLDSKCQDLEDLNSASNSPIIATDKQFSLKNVQNNKGSVIVGEKFELGNAIPVVSSRSSSPNFSTGFNERHMPFIPGLDLVNMPPPPPPLPSYTPPPNPTPPPLLELKFNDGYELNCSAFSTPPNMHFMQGEQYSFQSGMHVGSSSWNPGFYQGGYVEGSIQNDLAYPPPFHMNQPGLPPFSDIQIGPSQSMQSASYQMPTGQNEIGERNLDIPMIPCEASGYTSEMQSEDLKIVSLLLKKKMVAKTTEEAETIQKTIDILVKDSPEIISHLTPVSGLCMEENSIPSLMKFEDHSILHQETNCPGNIISTATEREGFVESRYAPDEVAYHDRNENQTRSTGTTCIKHTGDDKPSGPSFHVDKGTQDGSKRTSGGRGPPRINKHKKKPKTPPKVIPLVPLYKIKPFKDDGTPQEVPCDPRPAFYAAKKERLAMQKSLDDALETSRGVESSLINKGGVKTGNETKCDESTSKSPYKLVRFDTQVSCNPQFKPVKIDLDQQKTLCSSTTKNTSAVYPTANVFDGENKRTLKENVAKANTNNTIKIGIKLDKKREVCRTPLTCVDTSMRPKEEPAKVFQLRDSFGKGLQVPSTKKFTDKVTNVQEFDGSCKNKVSLKMYSKISPPDNASSSDLTMFGGLMNEESNGDTQAQKFFRRLANSGLYKNDEDESSSSKGKECLESNNPCWTYRVSSPKSKCINKITADINSEGPDQPYTTQTDHEHKVVGVVRGVVQHSATSDHDFDLRQVLMNQRSNNDLRNILGSKKAVGDLRDRLYIPGDEGKDAPSDSNMEANNRSPQWSPTADTTFENDYAEDHRSFMTERFVESYKKGSYSSTRFRKYASFQGNFSSAKDSNQDKDYCRSRPPSPTWRPHTSESRPRRNSWNTSENYSPARRQSPSPGRNIYQKSKPLLSKPRSPTPPKQYAYSGQGKRSTRLTHARSSSPVRKDKFTYRGKFDSTDDGTGWSSQGHGRSGSCSSSSSNSRPDSPFGFIKNRERYLKTDMEKFYKSDTKKFLKRFGDDSQIDDSDLFTGSCRIDSQNDTYSSSSRNHRNRTYDNYTHKDWEEDCFN